MRRQRKRSRTLSVMTLGALLIAGLMAPAAMAVVEGETEVDNEYDGVDGDDDACALHIDLEGSQLYRDKYERPGLKYKKQVKTFRTEYRFDKEKWVPGVKQYNYKKQVREREWTPEVEGIKEYEYEKIEYTYKRWRVQKREFPNKSVGSPHGDAYWIEPARIVNTDPLTINPLGNHNGHARVVDVSRFNVLGNGSYGQNVSNGTYIYRLVDTDVQTGAAPTKSGFTTISGPAVVATDWFASDPGVPWVATGNERWKDGIEPSPGGWGDYGPWVDMPGQVTGWFDSPQAQLNRPGGPWTVGVAKHLHGDQAKEYRYVQHETQWKPGTQTWVPVAQNLGPTTTPPSTTPFWVFGTLYRYTNVQSSEVFTGWQWFFSGGKFFITDWLNPGDQIDTGIPSVGLVDPNEEFTHGGKTYRYVEWKTRSMEEWVVEDVAGEGTTPPEGDGWVKTATEVVDGEPNMVRVTINGEVVEEATFGESYTETFLLDHDDEYLVEYKHHGDEDWSVYDEGIADCDQPPADVDFTEWEEDELECDSESVTSTRTKTTTPYIWDSETRTWVEDTENVVEETETDTRDLTAEEEAWQESEECIEIEDDSQEKPKPDEEPEVERVVVEKKVETEVLAETLPRTGASILTLIMSGLLALFVGTSALRRRHDRD